MRSKKCNYKFYCWQVEKTLIVQLKFEPSRKTVWTFWTIGKKLKKLGSILRKQFIDSKVLTRLANLTRFDFLIKIDQLTRLDCKTSIYSLHPNGRRIDLLFLFHGTSAWHFQQKLAVIDLNLTYPNPTSNLIWQFVIETKVHPENHKETVHQISKCNLKIHKHLLANWLVAINAETLSR